MIPENEIAVTISIADRAEGMSIEAPVTRKIHALHFSSDSHDMSVPTIENIQKQLS